MRITPNQRRLPEVVALLLALGVACDDGPTAPLHPGGIRVLINASGGEPNDDFLEIVVGSEVRKTIATRGESVLTGITAGSHTVALEHVSDNCTVSGTHPMSVTVPAGKTVAVVFVLICETTGIEVRTRTAGSEYASPFQVLVNDESRGPIAANGSLVVGRLRPGTHKVTLSIPGDLCSVAGGSQIAVPVSNRTVTPVLFEIACVPPVRSEKIAYVGDRPTNAYLENRISLVAPNGSLAEDLAAGHSPAWSPDGLRLVFSNTICDYYYGCNGGLVVMDPETRSFSVPSTGKGGFSPAWSPTGDAIAFTVSRRLYLIKLDGSPAVQLPSFGLTLIDDPAWDPSGRRIAFTCVAVPWNYDLCVVNRDGTGFVRFTSGEAQESDPAWSPDGSMIAFTRHTNEIAVMAADGSGVRRLTDGTGPSWSRDGAKLVFGRGDGLFTINVDGSNLTQLTKGNHYDPAWRP